MVLDYAFFTLSLSPSRVARRGEFVSGTRLCAQYEFGRVGQVLFYAIVPNSRKLTVTGPLFSGQVWSGTIRDG